MRRGLKFFSYSVAFFGVLAVFGAADGVHAEELTVTVKNGASVAITPSVDGTFASTEDEGNVPAQFSVTTDNYTGYKLSFTTGNDEEYATKLINTVTRNGETKTYALDSIDETVDGETFDSDKYNNMWGIKPNKYNSVENLEFLPVLPKMLLDDVRTSGTNDYTIAVGIRANYEYPAGKYTNTLVLTAIANPATYDVPVEFEEEANISEVTFTRVGEAEPEMVVSEASEKAILTYGVDYEVRVMLADGYEIEAIETEGGTFNTETGIYRIEATDEAPVLKITTRAVEVVESEV